MTATEEKIVQAANLQFMFPFKLKKGMTEKICQELLAEGFDFFEIRNHDLETRFYGEQKVSHRSLERYFLPNIEKILYPDSPKERHGLRRFSKVLNLHGRLVSKKVDTPYFIPSYDIFICPYEIGIINIRVEVKGDRPFSDVLEFAKEFRVMEPITEEEPNRTFHMEDKQYGIMKDFVFGRLCTGLTSYIDTDGGESPYFGSLPFFMDERMFVIAYYKLAPESIAEAVDLFRIGHLYGYDDNGEPFIGANNHDYIDKFCQMNVYDRWADETNFIASDYTFACVTNSAEDSMSSGLASRMYGIHFYSILLYYYYKIVLMKLSFDQSSIQIDKNTDEIEDLIIKITDFSSKYYFPEVNSSTVGKDIYEIVRRVFQLEYLYSHISSTLETLYQNQDKIVSKRQNYLLQILTLYTVISGIFGMNLAIQDWEGEINWEQIAGYTLFEWFALGVALSGIIIGLVLAFYFFRGWLKEKIKTKTNRY